MELAGFVELMASGGTYVNAQTLQFRGGEIRGKITGSAAGK